MSDVRLCQRCGLDIGAMERVGRRDRCLHCGSDLHCCLNCQLHDATMNNQCREPQAERQVDKQAGNFCEHFVFLAGRRTAGETTAAHDARQRLTALFNKKAP